MAKVYDFYEELLKEGLEDTLKDKLENVRDEKEYRAFIRDELLPLAKSKGYDLSVDDILAYDESVRQSLSEEELANVAGGGMVKNIANVTIAALSILTSSSIAEAMRPANPQPSPSSSVQKPRPVKKQLGLNIGRLIQNFEKSNDQLPEESDFDLTISQKSQSGSIPLVSSGRLVKVLPNQEESETEKKDDISTTDSWKTTASRSTAKKQENKSLTDEKSALSSDAERETGVSSTAEMSAASSDTEKETDANSTDKISATSSDAEASSTDERSATSSDAEKETGVSSTDERSTASSDTEKETGISSTNERSTASSDAKKETDASSTTDSSNATPQPAKRQRSNSTPDGRPRRSPSSTGQKIDRQTRRVSPPTTPPGFVSTPQVTIPSSLTGSLEEAKKDITDLRENMIYNIDQLLCNSPEWTNIIKPKFTNFLSNFDRFCTEIEENKSNFSIEQKQTIVQEFKRRHALFEEMNKLLPSTLPPGFILKENQVKVDIRTGVDTNKTVYFDKSRVDLKRATELMQEIFDSYFTQTMDLRTTMALEKSEKDTSIPTTDLRSKSPIPIDFVENIKQNLDYHKIDLPKKTSDFEKRLLLLRHVSDEISNFYALFENLAQFPHRLSPEDGEKLLKISDNYDTYLKLKTIDGFSDDANSTNSTAADSLKKHAQSLNRTDIKDLLDQLSQAPLPEEFRKILANPDSEESRKLLASSEEYRKLLAFREPLADFVRQIYLSSSASNFSAKYQKLIKEIYQFELNLSNLTRSSSKSSTLLESSRVTTPRGSSNYASELINTLLNYQVDFKEIIPSYSALERDINSLKPYAETKDFIGSEKALDSTFLTLQSIGTIKRSVNDYYKYLVRLKNEFIPKYAATVQALSPGSMSSQKPKMLKTIDTFRKLNEKVQNAKNTAEVKALPEWETLARNLTYDLNLANLKEPFSNSITKCKALLPNTEGRFTQIIAHEAVDLCDDILKNLSKIEKESEFTISEEQSQKQKKQRQLFPGNKDKDEYILKVLSFYKDPKIETLKNACFADSKTREIVLKILELGEKSLTNVDSLLMRASNIVKSITSTDGSITVTYDSKELKNMKEFITQTNEKLKAIAKEYNSVLVPTQIPAIAALTSWLELYGDQIVFK